MRTISSIPAYTLSRTGERDLRQSSGLRPRFSDEVRRSRSLQMVLTIAVPLLVAMYLTLGIIRLVTIASDVKQHPMTSPASTLQADQQ